jgi:hypothetical protein
LGSVRNSGFFYIVLGFFLETFEFLALLTDIGWVRAHVDHSGREQELALVLELGGAVFGDRCHVVDNILSFDADL